MHFESFGSYLKRKGLFFDLLAFGFILAWALLFDWRAGDLAWALWITSLVVGYVTMGIVIKVVEAPKLAGRSKGRRRGILLGFWAIFTVHFGLFHVIHCLFLNQLLPLIEPEGFPNIPKLLGSALLFYWPLVAMTLISRFHDLRKLRDDPKKHDALVKPYVNVVRLHLLIAALGLMNEWGLESLAIYAVLAACFFPWSAVIRMIADWHDRRMDRYYKEEAEMWKKIHEEMDEGK